MVDRIDEVTFARTVGLRSRQLAWFLGAGASAAAGIPTGWDMIRDFKTRLYCAQMGLPRREVDSTDPVWQVRIDSHFDGSNGLPAIGDPAEYGAAFEAVYPLVRDRRDYLEAAVQQGSPTFAHRVLASLVTAGHIRCLFTTNFDQLVERSVVVTDDLVPASDRANLTVGALDAVDRAQRCLRDDNWPLLVKLHGDYHSERLKNIPDELQTQDAILRSVLVDSLRRFGLVVVGYSGRDASVMDALEEAANLESGMPAGLWWVCRPGETLLPRVEVLLEVAAANGIAAHLVAAENFDELAGSLVDEVGVPDPLARHIDAERPMPLVVPAPFPTVPAGDFPVLRCSALEILDLPTQARSGSVTATLTTRDARELIREADVWVTAAVTGRNLSAFGADADIEAAFAERGIELGATRVLNPGSDTLDRGLVHEALARAVVRRRPLTLRTRRTGYDVVVRPPATDRTDQHAHAQRAALQELQIAYGAALTGTIPKTTLSFAEAVYMRLEEWDARWFCVFEPFTWVDLPRSSDGSAGPDRAMKELAGDWRRERWAQRYNKTWNAIIGGWAKVIAPDHETEITAHYFAGPGINASFRISQVTAWSRRGRAVSNST